LPSTKDNKVRIYEVDVRNGSLNESKILGEREAITCVKYSHDGNYLAVSDGAKNVKCYDIPKGYENITREMWQHHAAKITGLAWSPDSKHLASCGIDTHCMIYTPASPMTNIQIKSKF
jgi:WD40 repeat protein